MELMAYQMQSGWEFLIVLQEAGVLGQRQVEAVFQHAQ